MSTKHEKISELYADTCKTVVSSPKKWQEFLKSACRNYKLRFDELLLSLPLTEWRESTKSK